MKNWNTEDELVKNLKTDFKRNGIKATIRRSRGGWTPSLVININTTEDDFVSFDEFAKSYYPRYRWLYTEDNDLISYEGRELKITSNICLKESTYTLSLTDEYANLLNDVEQFRFLFDKVMNKIKQEKNYE